MSHGSAGRADLAVEIHTGATTDSGAEQGWRTSSRRRISTREEGSEEGSARGDATEPEKIEGVSQHAEEGEASQWRAYRQKGNISSLDLDAICMPRPPHQP